MFPGHRVCYALFIGRRGRAILQHCGSLNAMKRMAQDGNVDVITGDWLSEVNFAYNAIAKIT